MSLARVKVTFFQRKPRRGFSFSLEYIFSDLRTRLRGKINAEVKVCRFYNNGGFTKIYNVFEAAFRQNRTVNHITGELHFLNLLMRKKTVILTVLDCGMIHRKKGFARIFVKWLYLILPVRSAKYVTAISEETKREILHYTHCRPDKIKVIPVAVDPAYQPHTKEFDSWSPNVLHIGTGYNKNLLRLVESLRGISCQLQIVGKLNPEQKDALELSGIGYRNSYDLSKEELLDLYKQCDILAFVSTSEGFGMPIVEANSVERVVITSNISSMPEVAGDSAHLVDPYDVNDIRRGILRLINDKPYREELIKNGRRNRLRFDPEKIANAYLDLYREISIEN